MVVASAAANADLHHLAEVLRQRDYAIVVASFLELAEPDIASLAFDVWNAEQRESCWCRTFSRPAFTCSAIRD